MNILNNRSRVASFRLGGEYVPLVPSDMIRAADTYSTKVGPLTVKLMLAGHAAGFAECRVELINTGEERSAQITDFFGADIDIGSADATWESLKGDSCGPDTFLPLKKELADADSFTVEAVNGRSSQGDSFPFFDLHNRDLSAVFAIGWTGQWKYSLRCGNGAIRFTAGLTDCDFYLEPGESARSVSVIVCEGESVTDARQRFRRTFREKLSPAAGFGGKREAPLAMQLFDRYFWSHPSWKTEAEQITCVDATAKIGYFNTYWLDAAWFRQGFPNGVGNYSFTEGLKDGLSKVAARAHENGMKFMVWFEPERVFRGSEVWSEHRNYLLDGGNPDTDNCLYNLSDGKAVDWLTDKLTEMIRDNGIDVYRQDFNMDPLGFWRANDSLTPGRKGYTEIRYITNLYRMWDTLIERFPGLLIDNCSSGGRRLDFEMLKRSMPLWRSDTACGPVTPDRPVHMFNQNQTLGLSRYLPYHSASTWATDSYTVRSASTMGLAPTFDVLGDGFDFDSPKAALDEFVRLRRYWDGDFWPLTEGTMDAGSWSAFQLSFGCDEGMCLFFRRSGSREEKKVFALNAIDSYASYQLTLTDGSRRSTTVFAAGKTLASGYEAVVLNAEDSLVVEYRKL